MGGWVTGKVQVRRVRRWGSGERAWQAQAVSTSWLVGRPAGHHQSCHCHSPPTPCSSPAPPSSSPGSPLVLGRDQLRLLLLLHQLRSVTSAVSDHYVISVVVCYKATVFSSLVVGEMFFPATVCLGPACVNTSAKFQTNLNFLSMFIFIITFILIRNYPYVKLSLKFVCCEQVTASCLVTGVRSTS